GTGAGQSVSLPVLASFNGKTKATFIDVTGPVYAPAVTSATHGLTIRHVSSIDLSALQLVGPGGTVAPCGTDIYGNPGWVAIFDIDGSTTTALQLPALTSACMLFGSPGLDPMGNCTSGNLALSGITAPNVSKGGVQFFNNPSLPKCRADAL